MSIGDLSSAGNLAAGTGAFALVEEDCICAEAEQATAIVKRKIKSLFMMRIFLDWQMYKGDDWQTEKIMQAIPAAVLLPIV